MVDILLTTEDVAVLGGPDTVNVEVDFGPTGDRGSQIFSNVGKPVIGTNGITVLAPDCQLFDLYINILSTDDEYQYVYQLQNVLGTNTWVKLFKLVSNIYSKNYTATSFVDGVWTMNIPIAEIVPSSLAGSASAENFNIQYSVLNQYPIASSINVGEISTSGGERILPVTITASELLDGTFVSIDDIKVVQLFITVV
jgi:hypothetical protein